MLNEKFLVRYHSRISCAAGVKIDYYSACKNISCTFYRTYRGWYI